MYTPLLLCLQENANDILSEAMDLNEERALKEEEEAIEAEKAQDGADI